MTDNEQVALEFLGAWEQGDAKVLVSYFTDDVAYLGMPLPPRHGVAEVLPYLENMLAGMFVRMETLNIASVGDLVFTERIDWVRKEGTAEVALPVAGVMEFRDGKIASWREYFDLRTAEEGLEIVLREAAKAAGAPA